MEELEEVIRDTPEDEALRLAKQFIPKVAENIDQLEVIYFDRNGLLELAAFIQNGLLQHKIFSAAEDYCEDYKPVSSDSDYWNEIWFTSVGIKKFLKWCKPREKGLFDF